MKRSEARRFAQLYVHGPAAGLWEASAALAKIEPPARDDPLIRQAFEEIGAAIVARTKSSVVPPTDPNDILASLPTPNVSSSIVIPKRSELPPDDAEPDEWKRLAESLRDTIESVAMGYTKATAAQASLLRHILDRAYGRVVDSQKSKAPVGIALLPTVGAGSAMQICPKCAEEHLRHEAY